MIMQFTLTKKTVLALFVVIVFALAGYVGYVRHLDKVLGLASSSFAPHFGDVVGTTSGTSTTGVAFRTTATGGQSATTTYVSRIASNKNIANYTLLVTAASSTANVRFEVQGSNDDYCTTTNTDTAVDTPLTTDIRWFSAGDHLVGKSGTTSLVNASSTSFFVWNNPMPNVGQEILLTNLNYECLRLSVSGSSTVMHAGLSVK